MNKFNIDIPTGWDIKPLSDVLEQMTDFVANGSFQSLRENVEVFDSNNYAYYVRLYDIRLGIGHKRQKFVDKKSYKFLQKSGLFGGEILIANIGANVGEVFLMPEVNKPATIAPNMIILRIDKNTVNDYLFYYLTSDFGQSVISNEVSGSGQPKLNKTGLKKVPVILAPVVEQKKISAILTSVDNSIEKTEAIIKQTEKVNKGLMQQLLTKGIGHTKFKKTEIGEVPEKWEVVQFSKHITVNPTIQLKKGEEVPFVEMAAVNKNNKKISYYGNRIVGTSGGSRFKNDDTLFARITPCTENGKTAFVDDLPSEIGMGSTEFIVFSPDNSKVVPEFVYYLAKSHTIRDYAINRMIGTTGRQRVPKEVFSEELHIGLPTLKEQNEILTIFSAIENKSSIETQKLLKLISLKKSLMQVLLTGKVRVKLDEMEVTK